jgi:hypothetical protein
MSACGSRQVNQADDSGVINEPVHPQTCIVIVYTGGHPSIKRSYRAVENVTLGPIVAPSKR